MAPPRTFVTHQQETVHALFLEHRSMSAVARALGLSQIRVREALVQHERNRLRDAGVRPPPLKEMLRGDVTTRFGVPRDEFGGRPAKHPRVGEVEEGAGRATAGALPVGAARVIVTSAEAGATVHRGFWRNLQAYAAEIGAALLVSRLPGGDNERSARGEFGDKLVDIRVDLAGRIDIAADSPLSGRSPRPLRAVQHRREREWTVFPHPSVALETLTRLRADGLRVHMTTGAVTMPADGGAGREVSAVLAEIGAGGRAHCRHLVAPADGPGTFQDLDVVVERGVVRRGVRAEALCFGDIHHRHLDPAVARATWGVGRGADSGRCLVDRLRPRVMVFHDVCDFDARNAHDGRDGLRRFTQFATGGGDVAAEIAGAADFLRRSSRDWCESVVVSSNHDDGLVRWLREGDFRDDPVNALFFLEASLDLHRLVASGEDPDRFFEHALRKASADGLPAVRFLAPGEGLSVAGVEMGIHGHIGADGRPGSMRHFESLGIRATLGHGHRPLTRDGIYCVGVCQTELRYARGPLSGWAVGHVATYSNGARQHLLFVDGAFHA